MSLRSWLSSGRGTVQLNTERRDTSLQMLAEAQGHRLRTSAGVVVNDDQALRLAAVWGCVDLIAELVSTLPVHEFRRVDDRLVQVATPTFLEDPAGDGYGYEVWARQCLVSWLLRGNLYGWIERLGGDGWPVQVASVHPGEITARRDRVGGPVEWFRDNKPVERWPLGPLWHVPAFTVPGSPVGLSPITYAAQTIGLGLAAQNYGADWFGQGKIPPATLESDQVLSDTAAEAVKARINDALSAGGPLVLGAGLKFNPISVAPNEAQFLETIKANADDIARFFFRRPPGEGGSITYANVEARSLDLLTYTLVGYMVRLEKAITRLRPRPKVVKINEKALLRVDALTQARVADILVRSGLRSRDELREKDDYAPIPDGSGGEFLWPPGATSLQAIEGGESDGSPQPARTGT